MKSFFLLLTAIIGIAILTSFKAPNNEPGLLGRWHSFAQSNGAVEVTFDKDGFVTFTFAGQSKGGKDYVQDGEHMSMTFQVDTKTKPRHIDILTWYADDKKEPTYRQKGLYEIISANKIKIAFGKEILGPRPESFEACDKQNILILERIKP